MGAWPGMYQFGRPSSTFRGAFGSKSNRPICKNRFFCARTDHDFAIRFPLAILGSACKRVMALVLVESRGELN
jgi:hypothetical protein